MHTQILRGYISRTFTTTEFAETIIEKQTPIAFHNRKAVLSEPARLFSQLRGSK